MYSLYCFILRKNSYLDIYDFMVYTAIHVVNLEGLGLIWIESDIVITLGLINPVYFNLDSSVSYYIGFN